MNPLPGNALTANEISDVVINSLPGIFYLQDREGRYLRWNKNFEKILEYTADEIKQLNPGALLPADEYTRISELVRRIFEEGAGETETEVITKTGKRISFYLNGRAVNYEGQPCLIGMGIDISERVRMEKENKETESHLHALFDNVGGSVFLLDTQKRLVLYNAGLKKNFRMLAGRDPEPGEVAYAFLPPDEMKKRHEILDRVLQTGKKEEIEVVYERNGGKIFYRSGFNPIVTDGQITGISCYTIDITSLKRKELEIQKNQERLNYHIHNSPLAVIEYDRDFRITFWSKRDSDTFGWSEGEVLGKKITDFLVHKDDVAAMMESLHIQEHSTDKAPISIRNYTRDGRVIYCRWHSSFLADEKGDVNTIMSIVRDISDLHKAELQKEAIASDLIRRNNDLEQFTYIVSHNLRAPIARVIGLSDILAEFELDDDEKKEIISGISQSAHRLDDIIKDLNGILHLKSNLNESKEVVVLSKLVEEIEQNIRHFNLDEFVIDTDFSQSDGYYTIKNYLVSIFSNLISNSIKYRQPEKAPVIKITSVVDDGMLILTFRDNGIGFDMTEQGDEIFGLYKRFHFHVEGKGLGLFMVKSQVETLGGQISVKSAVNEGTEFEIRFPL